MSQLYSYSLCNSTIDLSPVPGASSEGSSPRSSSTDDDLLEIRASEQNACNHSKPIYNFSIPDFIKHERQPDTNAADNSEMDSPVIVSECVPRARVMNMKRRRERVDDIEERETGNRLGLSAGFAPARRHKRKRGNHRDPVSSPQLIDLTDSTDQEDAVTPGVRDEINHSPYLDSALTGVAEHSWDLGASQSPHTPSLNSVTDDLQDFGIRLRASRERLDQLRRDVAASGLVLSQQGAGQSQNIVSDGLAYPSNHDGDARGGATALSETFELLNQAAPIINVDDDTIDPVTPDREGGRQMAARMLQDRDREIAARMFEDPFYSPPFLTPRNVRQRDSSPRPRPTMRPVLTTIEEDLDRIRQTTREQIASFERVRQQTRTRLNEARNRMSRIAHRNMIDIFPLPVPDSPPENRQSEDEVEFLRELRPPNSSANRNARASHADLDANNETNYNWGHLSRARRRFSGLLANPNLNVPDFLFPYVQLFSPSVAPRLHHFPSNNTDEGEDYEALWNLAERLGPAKPRGLSKTEIDRIHAFRFSAACAEETNSTCVVCMSEYIFREKIRKLPCSHDFHSKCIDKWLRSNKTCPVCRDEVKCI